MTLKHSRGFIFPTIFALIAIVVASGLRSADSSQETSIGKCDKRCLQAKVNGTLILMGEVGKDDALESSLKDLRAAGPPLVRVVQDTYDSWSRTDNTLAGNARPPEMRWRTVHLLGLLDSPEATTFLYELAKKPLPDPKAGELAYVDEYRLRLRAIDGLERLKAVEQLKVLHELGGVLSNPTAVSLFALGVNVGGVSRVEARKALADELADSKDYHPGKGRAPQRIKPDDPKSQPTRRPDTPFLRRQRQGN